MSNDNLKPDSKKSFPGGFFIFLVLAILIILTIQNMSSDRTAKIAFSHQVEHLINLDLIQKEDSRKIALNDNLVTFSGKFKDKVTEEAKARFRYLELLNRNNDLTGQKKEIDQEITASRQSVFTASDLFLHLSGQPLPKTGYLVVESCSCTFCAAGSFIDLETSASKTLSCCLIFSLPIPKAEERKRSIKVSRSLP